ncbi:MAG: hypothetical protein GEEBNDBF_01237 [bacterium]|nr:hypothetical protein [bacterium]
MPTIAGAVGAVLDYTPRVSFLFRRAADSSLVQFGQRMQATYAGRFDPAAAQLAHRAGFRPPQRWPLQWHGVARWRMDHDALGMLGEFSVQPLNGPRTRRLVGILQFGQFCPAIAPIVLLGPTRWEGPLEAPLVPPYFRRCDVSASWRGLGIGAMSPTGDLPSLPDFPDTLLPSIVAAEGHLLSLDAQGAWFLLPATSDGSVRLTAHTLLSQLATLRMPLAIPVPELRPSHYRAAM